MLGEFGTNLVVVNKFHWFSVDLSMKSPAFLAKLVQKDSSASCETSLSKKYRSAMYRCIVLMYGGLKPEFIRASHCNIYFRFTLFRSV